jgi:hypothetical protein
MIEERGSTGSGGHPDDDGREEREHTFSRKALIKAGWAVPVAMAVAPAAAFAASGPHTDHTDHVDGATGHTDAV